MSDEDEDDSDSFVAGSDSLISTQKTVDDLGQIVSKVLIVHNSGGKKSGVFDQLIEMSREVNPNPHFFLVESGKPNIYFDFSKAKEIIESIKALTPEIKVTPEDVMPKSYSELNYGEPEKIKDYLYDSQMNPVLEEYL